MESHGNRKGEPVLRKGVTEALRKLETGKREADEGAEGRRGRSTQRLCRNLYFTLELQINLFSGMPKSLKH